MAFTAGALILGAAADAVGLEAAICTAAALIAASTAVVAVRMREPLGSTEWTAVSKETP